MATYSTNGKIFCPFFKTQRDRAITCEGIGLCSLSIQEFKTNALKKNHVISVCSSKDYANHCPFAMALSSLYDKAK